ncbi:MAG: aminoacetone oxidase family FAD-binding enzyme [Anaerolineae bacterium]|jgi:predicted Rossmann fold flavoprotein|nr:aminoacetone oxidase family FAD-binding enzyme [Anaerolineae bacterium]
MKENRCDLAVIGGGPAGFFGALQYAALRPAAEVIILEKTDRVLQKVLISGGGRCNITHDCDDPRELIQSYPRGGKALLSGLYGFGPSATLHWFRERGLDFYTDEIGCVFPVTDQSQSVIDVLLKEAELLGVRIWQDAGVDQVEMLDDSFLMDLPHGNQLQANKILWATGGNRQSIKLLRQMGIPIINPVPSLFPFRLSENWLMEFAGLSVEACTVAIPGTEFAASGTVLITHHGISGPGVIRLSSWAARYLKENNYNVPVQIDWLAQAGNQEQTLEILKIWKKQHANKQVATQPVFSVFANRLWQGICTQVGAVSTKRWGDVSNGELAALNQMLRAMPLTITSRDQHKQEYVTCGGVDLQSVNLRTMESKTHPNLFFAGEVLDIDGLTGGYNLQNCWTTGWLAGNSLASAKQ